MFELLHEVVIKQAVFESIHRTPRLRSDCFEVHLHQKGTGDIIALNADFSALAAFNPG